MNLKLPFQYALAEARPLYKRRVVKPLLRDYAERQTLYFMLFVRFSFKIETEPFVENIIFLCVTGLWSIKILLQ